MKRRNGKKNNPVLSKQAKIIVDIVLAVGLVLLLTCHDIEGCWVSSHCITGMLSVLAMAVHIWQHWRFIKALVKKKVILKNKITVLITICFILISVSILLFITGFEPPYLKLHNVTGHFFVLAAILHAVQKIKRFFALFKV